VKWFSVGWGQFLQLKRWGTDFPLESPEGRGKLILDFCLL
jgi:hypothetical protein